MWVFDGAAKSQKKAEPAEEEKVKRNEHSESVPAIESLANNEAIARQPAQISKEAVQSAKDEQHQQNVAVENLDTMDDNLNDESFFDRPSFNFRTYLKGQVPLSGGIPIE